MSAARKPHYDLLIDIGNTSPGWLGPFNFLSLLLLTVVTGWVLGGAARLGHR